jgi:hypothetical protein
MSEYRHYNFLEKIFVQRMKSYTKDNLSRGLHCFLLPDPKIELITLPFSFEKRTDLEFECRLVGIWIFTVLFQLRSCTYRISDKNRARISLHVGVLLLLLLYRLRVHIPNTGCITTGRLLLVRRSMICR